MSSLSLRKAKLRDIPSVWNIEKISFKRPWSISSFLLELKNPFSYFYVIEKEKRIAGYFVLWDMGEEFHLANIAVHPDERRKGYGKFMLKKIIEMAKRKGKQRVRLEVRVSNTNAINLYKKLGFQETGIIKGYYGDEDGIEFVYKLKSNL